MVRKAWVSGLGVLGGLLVGGHALAQTAEGNVDSLGAGGEAGAGGPARGMNNTISLLGNLGYAYSAGTGFGLSGRFQHTVVEEGFLESRSVFDDFGIEGAVDYYHYSWDLIGISWTYNEVRLSASAVWNLWFSENFAAYPRLGLGYGFGSWSDNSSFSNPAGYGGLFFVGGAGVLYELDVLTLRAEVSNGSLGLGAAISL